MIVHLIDGTYELFRHFYGIRLVPPRIVARLHQTLGIVHVDFATLKRTLQESAKFYAEVVPTGGGAVG